MRRGIAPLAPTWKKTHALCRDQRHVVATYSSAQVQLAYLTSLVNLSLRGGGGGGKCVGSEVQGDAANPEGWGSNGIVSISL